MIGPLVAPVALAGGVVLQLLYPGDFGYILDAGGPAWATWVAVVGCVVALFVAARSSAARAAGGARLRAPPGSHVRARAHELRPSPPPDPPNILSAA